MAIIITIIFIMITIIIIVIVVVVYSQFLCKSVIFNTLVYYNYGSIHGIYETFIIRGQHSNALKFDAEYINIRIMTNEMHK